MSFILIVSNKGIETVLLRQKSGFLLTGFNKKQGKVLIVHDKICHKL